MNDNSANRPRQSGRKMIDGGFMIIIAVTVVGATAVYLRDGPVIFWQLLTADAGFMFVLMLKILAGVFVAAALPMLVPHERVQRAIGPRSGFRGLAIATLAGAAVPGGPAVALPLAAGLVAAGADIAAMMTMITAWMLLGVYRTLIWELSLLPADVVLLRYGLSLPIPILIGWFLRRSRFAIGRAP